MNDHNNMGNNNGYYNNGMKSFDQMNQNFKNGQYYQNQNNMNNNYQNNNMYNNYINKENISSAPPKERYNRGKIIIPIIIIFVLLLSVTLFTFTGNSYKKSRTFMIYMVGSDLETQSKQGTYSIDDIVGGKIDLNSNNVILMVGGAKKWHNFVDSNEIGIYELTENGFEKKESLEVKSMGTSSLLSSFLNYSYENYPAKDYDMIFWNHGLGAIGIEQDELSNDYLSISELNEAFENSRFNNNKLEMTIFYNCLASNLHIAKIMSKYSNYMVASEEIFYLSRLLNRLNFMEKINNEDTAYDIGLKFIEQSDKVVSQYNASHVNKIDSTLSIIDLTKIKELDSSLNEFVKSINVSNNYNALASIRRSIYTYGNNRVNDYDTIDLYNLTEKLESLSTNKSAYKKVIDSINSVVLYTSNLNDHSNGIAVYFPYYGSKTAIEVHLNTFNKLWNDNYYSFINNFYQIRSGVRRARLDDEKAYKLSNKIKNDNNKITLTLSDEEKNNYQKANIYLFEKNEDKYELLLKTDDVSLNGNKLVSNDLKKLKVNNQNISLLRDNLDRVYGTLSDDKDIVDSIFILGITDDSISINEVNLDSKKNPVSGLIEFDDYNKLSLGKLKYDIREDNLQDEEWKETEERELVELDKNALNMTLESPNKEYYVLIEVYDIYNEVFYSSLTNIK